MGEAGADDHLQLAQGQRRFREAFVAELVEKIQHRTHRAEPALGLRGHAPYAVDEEVLAGLGFEPGALRNLACLLSLEASHFRAGPRRFGLLPGRLRALQQEQRCREAQGERCDEGPDGPAPKASLGRRGEGVQRRPNPVERASVLRPRGEQRLDESGFFGRLPAKRSEVRAETGAVRLPDVPGRVSGDRVGAGGGEVEHDAERIEVTLRRRRLPFEQLRGHGQRRSVAGWRRAAPLLRGTEVHQDRPLLPIQPDVGRLQITVDDALLVDGGESCGKVGGETTEPASLQRPTVANPLREIPALEEIGPESGDAVLDVGPVHSQHAGMMHARVLPGLGDQLVGIQVRAVVAEELQCHVAVEHRVVGPEDPGEAPLADHGPHLETAPVEGADRLVGLGTVSARAEDPAQDRELPQARGDAGRVRPVGNPVRGVGILAVGNGEAEGFEGIGWVVRGHLASGCTADFLALLKTMPLIRRTNTVAQARASLRSMRVASSRRPRATVIRAALLDGAPISSAISW